MSNPRANVGAFPREVELRVNRNRMVCCSLSAVEDQVCSRVVRKKVRASEVVEDNKAVVGQ